MSLSCFTITSPVLSHFLRLTFMVAGSVTFLTAQERLTPTTLAAWNATGSAPKIAPDRATVILPAGGQIARSYLTGPLLVSIVSRPFFSAQADSRPIVEVGPASLIFVRNEKGGGVVMLGDQLVLLPSAIVLGTDGRSISTVDLSLYFDNVSSRAVLVLNGETYPFAAKPSAAQFEIAVSAGSEADWAFDKLEVVASLGQSLPYASTDVNGSPTIPLTGEASKAQDLIAAAEGTKNFGDSRALFKSRDLVKAEKVLLKSNRWATDTIGWRLESAGKLTQMALTLRQEYDHTGAITVAQRALQILREDDRPTVEASGREKSAMHEMAAYIAEEILRDPDAAREGYEQSLKISAESVRARSGIQRLNEARTKTDRLGRKD